MSTAKIASIYFAPVECDDLMTFGFGIFKMPAVKFGDEPFVLEVEDKIQHDKGPFNGMPTRQMASYPHTGQSIARSLVRAWSQLGHGMTPDCHPGIWVVRESMPQIAPPRVLADGSLAPEEQAKDAGGTGLWRPATESERSAMWAEDLAAAKAADRKYAAYLFMQANIMAEKPAMIQFIPTTTRLAAVQYGKQFDWMREGAAEESKSCQWCTKRIAIHAAMCPECGKVVDAKRFAALERQMEAELEEARTAPEVPKIPAPTGKRAMGLQPVGA